MASQRRPEIDGPEAFAATFGVSRETVARLETYAELLKRWQRTINLVAPSTVNDVWRRHFADSAQLWQADTETPSPTPGGEFPANPPHEGEGASSTRGDVVHWLDVGSGAGFPGLVVAILAAEVGGTRHTLIESDNRKAAFIREVARTVGVPVDIVCARIESAETRDKVQRVDRVTARALAPLPRLLELVYPYFASHTVGLFAKGREAASEIEEARSHFNFDCELKPSLTDESGRIVVVRSLAASGGGRVG